jgi:hypothetical protein
MDDKAGSEGATSCRHERVTPPNFLSFANFLVHPLVRITLLLRLAELNIRQCLQKCSIEWFIVYSTRKNDGTFVSQSKTFTHSSPIDVTGTPPGCLIEPWYYKNILPRSDSRNDDVTSNSLHPTNRESFFLAGGNSETCLPQIFSWVVCLGFSFHISLDLCRSASPTPLFTPPTLTNVAATLNTQHNQPWPCFTCEILSILRFNILFLTFTSSGMASPLA